MEAATPSAASFTRGKLNQLISIALVLINHVGANRARDGGAFTVMKFPPEMEDPGLVYLELLTGGQYFEKPEEIAQYRRALSHLHAFAASPKTSCGIIERRLKEVK